MSDALPASPAPTSATLRSLQPTRVSVAHSLKRQARTRGAQRWGMRLTWDALTRDQFAPLQAFLLAQRGQADSFTLTLSGHNTPRGSWAGTPQVSGADQAGRNINIGGLVANQASAAKAGDLLKFSGHSKVYLVTLDASSNSAGQATLVIEPALIASIANAEAIMVFAVPFTVALVSDSLDANLMPGGFYSLDIDVAEVW